jgi:transposase
VATREEALRERFSGCSPMLIALETGSHSPWVSRVLEDCGHEVLVANSRKLRLIYENPSKDDRVDALYLARLARVEPGLLSPVQHRGVSAQKDLAFLRSRDALVAARTQLINHVRGLVTGSTKCEWKPGETTPPSELSYLHPVFPRCLSSKHAHRAQTDASRPRPAT